jgi:small subunit ribosomal protein S21
MTDVYPQYFLLRKSLVSLDNWYRLWYRNSLRSGGSQRPMAFVFLSPRRRRPNSKDFCVQVLVRDNNVDQALKALKKKMQREGIFREMKLRGHYEKPSEKRAREKAEALRRARKLARKKLQREGLLPMKPKPLLPAR